jgi:putative flippase GtrA
MVVYVKKMYKKHEEIVNYLIVGVLTTVVSLVTYFACTLTFLNPHVAWELQLANLISWVCAVAFAYVTNRIFVFKSKNKNILKEVSSFTYSRIVTLLMDMFIMFIIVTVLKGNDKIGKLVSQVVVTIGNYILSKLFVFKGVKDGQ